MLHCAISESVYKTGKWKQEEQIRNTQHIFSGLFAHLGIQTFENLQLTLTGDMHNVQSISKMTVINIT